MSHHSTSCLVLVVAVLFGPQSAWSQWGTVKGEVKVAGIVPRLPSLVNNGDKVKDAEVCSANAIPDESIVVDPGSNGLANVAVYLVTKPDKIHPDLVKSKKDEIVVRAMGCQYIPHFAIVRTDQAIRVTSPDPIAHIAHVFARFNRFESLIVTPDDDVKRPKKPEKLPVRMTCDIHPWMVAYLLIVDHPYAAVTNSKGEFEIADLPEGEHEFHIWHESIGFVEKSFKVTVRHGVNQLDSIQVKSERFLQALP